ncbi:MAG TPA: hypothetical protein VLD39_12485, partial [Gammaproteobacteria bacterium]|nr:hypothetical protein [Gammaproteobacteria bacterium]
MLPGLAFAQVAFVPLADPAFPLVQSGYLKPSNAEAYDHFACGGASTGHTGNSIAISRDGRIMAIGAAHESSGATGVGGDQGDNTVLESGAVYVFERSGGGWEQRAYLKASNTGLIDHFGSSVVMSHDGSTLVVSAPFESSGATGVGGDQGDDSVPQAGAVYVFTRSGNSWRQEAYLKASNTGRAGQGDDFGDGDQFGYSIALSGDGRTLAVGAIAEDSAARGIDGDQSDDSAISSGAVYLFARGQRGWTQQAYLKASNSQAGDLFGFSVALSADGNTLAASSYDEDGSARVIDGPDDNAANAAGAVFVFERDGARWTEATYLKGSRSERTDQLGYSVAISDDGNTIASGAGDEDCLLPGVNPPGCDYDSPDEIGANVWIGAAYVFVRDGDGWAEQAFLKASNPRPYNSFGVKIALSGDGDTLAVAAYLEDEAARGVYGPELFPLMIVPNLDPWREGLGEAVESGAVYLYTRENAEWRQRAYIKASNADIGDEFGS